MTDYQYQPDFVITINGTDVTKVTESWELNDVEDQISNLTVTIINTDMKYSGQFKIDGEITIRFGYQSNMGPQVTMKIKEVTEIAATRGCRITVTGMDILAESTSATARGFYKTQEVDKILKEMGESIDAQVDTGDAKSPKFPEGYKHPVPNERLYDAMHRYKRYLGSQQGGGKSGSVGKGGGDKAIKKQKGGKKAGSFQGDMSAGLKLSQGPITSKEKGDIENAQKNYLKNVTNEASSISLRANAELIGVPMLQAKKGITFQNVGGKGNGEWYAKGVAHSWSVGGGYHTRVDMIRSGGGDQPMVMYAEIYQKGKVYCGPRKIDSGSQGTFTFGQGDKRVTSFKWTESMPSGTAAGEKAQTRNIPIDNASENVELKAE